MCSSNTTICLTDDYIGLSRELTYSICAASLFSWLRPCREQTLSLSNSPFQLQQMLIILTLTSVCMCVFPFTEVPHISSAAGWRERGKKEKKKKKNPRVALFTWQHGEAVWLTYSWGYPRGIRVLRWFTDCLRIRSVMFGSECSARQTEVWVRNTERKANEERKESQIWNCI